MAEPSILKLAAISITMTIDRKLDVVYRDRWRQTLDIWQNHDCRGMTWTRDLHQGRTSLLICRDSSRTAFKLPLEESD